MDPASDELQRAPSGICAAFGSTASIKVLAAGAQPCCDLHFESAVGCSGCGVGVAHLFEVPDTVPSRNGTAGVSQAAAEAHSENDMGARILVSAACGLADHDGFGSVVADFQSRHDSGSFRCHDSEGPILRRTDRA